MSLQMSKKFGYRAADLLTIKGRNDLFVDWGLLSVSPCFGRCEKPLIIKEKIGTMYKYIPIILMALLAGCTSMKVVKPDPQTGLFPATKTATITKNMNIDLDSKKALILVPNGDFTVNMVKNIGYFDEVINFEDLEKIIIKEDLTDSVPSVDDRIGLNKAAKAYKPFLWLRWDTRQDGSKKYTQLILTDPITLEDYFVTETYLDHVWAGVNDQNNFYPMFNAFVKYLKQQSESF